MNFNVFLAEAAQTGNWSFLIMMGLIFVVMYFFMIRPQQKKQKELARFRSSLAKGDKVVTLGGIYGVVSEVKDQYILVEVDSNVKLRIDKSAIVKDITDIPAGK
ncbi:MAG: preprotein translocase subunit YajC [Bacteroidetes bacterium GWE2_39_28]|jgi:preprotein translocase subunit YajC|nr:preprotein translocase subunit YajC [Bacteroidales bacterium]OFX77226.1 MAG: preprotein translocase subunit YajC [Bacteroidetes bacterium GWE2_39_28]OFY15162.1 MAG: preprotein translocase subunit YajC [Bacteroidetes bacterium GWF2_39_10]OFZ10971.1 MAG: preprotein translocase subunit YajC [Bacteroidetes bacterium RIFOXYC2_FULL_39_11]HCT93785.1 preprotein translocase subunit YajC [Rikenellaceae bacterium]